MKTRLPKLCGGDFELANFILGLEMPSGTAALASHLLLREFDGLPLARKSLSLCYCRACVARRQALENGYTTTEALSEECLLSKSGSTYNAQDWARKFLWNGGCAYIDLSHLELCIAEVLSAKDHVAASRAMLLLARAAMKMANARLPEGKRIVVLANNSDGQGHSYGSHINFLVTRSAWTDLFERRLHHLLFLAAYQASSIIFTGQGKVGSENNRPSVDYQISQRADFMDMLMGSQTTFTRPLVNSRDEALCGSWYDRSADSTSKARLHVIFYDHTLCDTASFLKIGVMQIILAMIEAGRVRTHLLLDDPVEALCLWSHDPTLRSRARLTSGRSLTAVELQLLLYEEAHRFVAAGGCDGVVPEAPLILELWSDTLHKLRQRDFAMLARRLDWVLKLQLLERAREHRAGLDWSSPELKHLDFLYASLDENGLFWALEKNGQVDKLVTDEQVERFCTEPPENTRAWTRGMLLRLAEPRQVERVDWDSMTFSVERDGYWTRDKTIKLTDPLGFTKTACESAFQGGATLEEVLVNLGADASPVQSPIAVKAEPSTTHRQV
ncbi:MAG: hypothetical protein C5B50_02210 [Verrucomicrobia bacterium]|nr:MAG: hypothetical protein C5B50_02210 [Verrucomicrobiota bacterium]